MGIETKLAMTKNRERGERESCLTMSPAPQKLQNVCFVESNKFLLPSNYSNQAEAEADAGHYIFSINLRFPLILLL